MSNVIQNNILVIGGPNAGKTHFGGQLYGRLNNRSFKFKIDPNNRPEDLTIFQDVLDKLYQGKRAGHTEASANRSVQLKIIGNSNNDISFSFPDYGGEQVKSIVYDRRVNNIWKGYIEDSTAWMLFVRLDEIHIIKDITINGIPDDDELAKRKTTPPPVKVSDVAYFVELLQMLIYIKRLPTLQKMTYPKLTVVLSCWDTLDIEENVPPNTILKEKMPMLYNFINSNWDDKSYNIIGLSSTQKTLTDEPDDDFIDGTPINFGYFVNEKGKKETDLTLSIETLIGNG